MPTIAKPKPGEDVRTLHNYVRELVKHTNALINMTALVQGRISGWGGLEISGGSARMKIYTGDPGTGPGGRILKQTPCLIASTHNPVDYGITVQWVATVATDATGTIQFYIDGGAWGGPVPVVNGVAVSAGIVGGSQLRPGNHVIQANYSGDYIYSAASGTLGQVVNGLNRPTMTAFGNPNPANARVTDIYGRTTGDHIFLGANVTAQNPVPPAPNITGNVRFFVNGRNVGDYPLAFLSGQTWRAVTNDDKSGEFGVGNTPVQATYLGDNNYGQATASYTQQVKAAGASVLTISPNPVTPGKPITFYVTVTGSPGGPVPTGTVNLSNGGVPYLSPQTLVNGATSFYVPAGLPVGVYQMQAYYHGDNRYTDVNSAVVELDVKAQIGFEVSATPAWSGLEGAAQTLHVAVLGDSSAHVSAKVIILDSHMQCTDVYGNVNYSGPVIPSWSNSSFQNTPFDVVFGQVYPDPAHTARAPYWVKFQVQYATGQVEQVYQVLDPQSSFYADQNFVFGTTT